MLGSGVTLPFPFHAYVKRSRRLPAQWGNSRSRQTRLCHFKFTLPQGMVFHSYKVGHGTRCKDGGAINGAIIAGNDFEQRLDRLREFWDRLERKSLWSPASLALIGGNFAAQLMTIFGGISGYFAPNRALAWGLHAPVGVERAGFYTIEALHETLSNLVDFARLNSGKPRLTVGAVNVRSGNMHYFDSRDMPLTLKHVLASGALPPAFPAIRIDGDPYWDGGIYSNTPIETVLDDKPRQDSVIFAVDMWNPEGSEPET